MPDLRLNILVIEDEPVFFRLVTSILSRQEGLTFNAKLAECLGEGLVALADDKSIDVVLLDLGLPDSTGLEAVTAVRSAAPRTPIVVLTGQQDGDLTGQVLHKGGQEYLGKAEVSPKTLFRVIRYAIERKQMEEALLQYKEGLERRVEERTAELVLANQRLGAEIENRQRMEEALRQSENHYRVLTESLTDVIWTSDLDLHFSYISPVVKTLLGFEPQELMAMRRGDILTPESEALAFEVLGRELAKAASGQDSAPSVFSLELELKRKNGTTLWTEARATFLRDHEGNPSELLVVTRDITENRRTRIELQRNFDIQRVLNALLGMTLDDNSKEEFLSKALKLLLSVPWLTLESKGAIFLVEDEPDTLVMKVQGGLADPILQTCSRVAFGNCLCGRAAASGQIVFADQVDDRHDVTYHGMIPHGHYCLPMLVGGKVIGVITLYLQSGHVPREGEREFLAVYSNALAMVIAGRRAEKALRASEARTRSFLELLPDPLVVYDMEGRALIINSAFEETFGWSRTDLLEKKIMFVPSEALPDTIVSLERIKNGESVRGFVSKRLTKDGRKLDVIINTSPYFEEGKQSGNMVVLRDITELAASEKALRQSELRYRNLVEAIPEGIVTVSADHVVTFVNRPYASMMGYAPEEMIGKDVESFFDKEGKEIFQNHWMVRRQGIREPYEASMAKKDGGRIFVIIYPTPLSNEYGHFVGATALVTDITKRKILESQLLQAQKLEAIGQLAAGIAHEINTPTQYVSDNTRFLQQALGGVLALLHKYANLTQVLKEHGPYDELLSELDETAEDVDLDYLIAEIPLSIEQTLQGLERIATIVRSMKEFAHPGPASRTPTDINRAIENTVTVAKNEWKYVADVVTNLEPTLPLVNCTPGEINQVILNLLVNAAHAIGDVTKERPDRKGIISISTKQEGDWVAISLSDDGPGIPEAIRGRIFDPFFTTKDPGKGTGQGLALAHTAIVNNHHGTISVNSELGRGTTFIVRLPLGNHVEVSS